MAEATLFTPPALPASATITAQSGSNLALAFGCLPPERRRAMGIFYAFCRVIDDASDSTTLTLEQKRAELTFWRDEIGRGYGGQPLSPLGKEMAEIIATYKIPQAPLDEILNGVEMDLSLTRYPNFAALEQYCYRVASAVGLVSIEIFSYRHAQTRDYAVALGLAFQLTNILRDVKKDAANGRIYLPQDELAEFGLSDADILASRWSPQMRKFLKFQHFRAQHYYAKSLRLLSADRPTLTAAEIMREVYESLLKKIEKNDFNVFKKEIRLSKPAKVLCIARANRREKRALPLPSAPKNILVLGGGFAGVSAALELIVRGHAVTLLEAKPFLGGRAYSFKEAKSGETLDNGQHILMGCYEETLSLLNRLDANAKLEVQNQLEVPFLSPRGSSVLRAANLPAPFHLLAALSGYRELRLSDQWAAIKLSLRLRFGQKPRADETATAWLQRWNQSPRLINALWEPLCLAALNQSLAHSSATLLATVLERALLASPTGSKLILSRVGLSELLSPETELLHRWCGAKVISGAHVQRLLFDGKRCTGVETLDGRAFAADHVVSALPWNVLRGLVPPESALAKQCAQIPDSPIVSVHLWFDRPLFDQPNPIIGFLDSPLHWLFDRAKITGESSKLGHPYVAVISGAANQAEKSPAEIEAEVVGEIHRFLPASRDAVINHRFVYKARAATFAATPEVEPKRPAPGPTAEWPNLFLAGDWTATALPGTIESAVLSGRLAAEALDAV